jgi:glycerol-3-phosphate dehydrogenase
MAKDAVDAAVHASGQQVPECRTEDVPIIGADGYLGYWNARIQMAARWGLRTAQVEHLLNRYGSLIEELLELVEDRPDLKEPLRSAPEYLKVEALYAVTHEGALHLDDILARRTRISIETWDRGVSAAEEVAHLVAPALGWNDATIEREIDHYRKRVEAERDSQEQPDDRSADAARLGAADVRMGRWELPAAQPADIEPA